MVRITYCTCTCTQYTCICTCTYICSMTALYMHLDCTVYNSLFIILFRKEAELTIEGTLPPTKVS